MTAPAVVRVVVADDDADYRFLIRAALADCDDIVVTDEVSDASELAAAVTRSTADLVLVDCSMPGGLAAVPAVRAARPSARVVLVSTLPSTDLALATPGAGAVGFLTKDVRVADLPGVLRDLAAMLDAASTVLARDRASLEFDARSGSAARRLTRDALGPWVDGDTVDTAVLAVSELVTNAVVHAQSEVDVQVSVLRDAIRIEIGDASETPPAYVTADLNATSGRGIALVSQLASRWGVRPRRLGKTVWFELPRAHSAVAP